MGELQLSQCMLKEYQGKVIRSSKISLMIFRLEFSFTSNFLIMGQTYHFSKEIL